MTSLWRALLQAWHVPLRWHVLVLAVIVALAVPVIGTSSSFNNDEGAYILQARQLQETGTWLSPNPLPSVDPEGQFFYVRLSTGGPNGFAYYSGHPLYPVLLSILDGVGGVRAMVFASAAAAVVAAVTGAWLSRQLIGGGERAALWALGVGSPLLFASQQVIAHTAGAACAGAAAGLTVRAWRSCRLLPFLGAAACVAVAILLRTEAALFAAALAAMVVAVASRARGRRLVHALVGAGLLLASAALALSADRLWSARIRGGSPALAVPDAGDDVLASRLSAGARTLFGVPVGAPWSAAALVVGASVVVAAAVLVRTGNMNQRRARVSAAAAVVSAGAVFVFTTSYVPGLLLVCPVITAGAVLIDPADVVTGDRPLVVGTGLLFAGAVLLTQYAQGGALEWGARFLVLGLPLLVAASVAVLIRAGRSLSAPVARPLIGGLAALSVLLGATALRSQWAYHRTIDEWVQGLESVLPDVGPTDLGDGDRRPVVIASVAAFGRWMWPTFASHRGLEVPESETCSVARRLVARGVVRLVLVTPAPVGPLVCDGDLAVVRTVSAGDKGTVWITLLERR